MKWINEHIKIVLLSLILIIGFLVRIVGISDLPQGLNVDEVSSGYEAYSIANYGIDRNGNFLPVFLVAWGSGQNALYTYVLIPFVKILGLSVFSIRFPMALIGCISLIVMYFLLKNIGNEKLALIGTAFLAICPWHIMKSRWGLESNLFPDIILLSVFVLIYGIKKEKSFFIYLSFIIAGISAYSYGTSYFFLPIFLIPLVIYLCVKKKLTIKQGILGIVIVGIVSFPIILFVIINKFDLPQINLPFMTIPRLTENRFEEVASVFSSDFIKNSIENFTDAIKIFLITRGRWTWLEFYFRIWNNVFIFNYI